MEGSEGAATSAASACSLVISVQAGFSGQGQAGPAGSPPPRAWCSQGRLPLCWEDRHLAPSVPRLPLPCPRPQEATAPVGSLSVRHHCFPILASCSAWCLPQGAWSRRPRSASEEPVQGSWRGGRLCNCEVCVCVEGPFHVGPGWSPPPGTGGALERQAVVRWVEELRRVSTASCRWDSELGAQLLCLAVPQPYLPRCRVSGQAAVPLMCPTVERVCWAVNPSPAQGALGRAVGLPGRRGAVAREAAGTVPAQLPRSLAGRGGHDESLGV